jgi:glycosyltransferase involved in cell wall biosynthesis
MAQLSIFKSRTLSAKLYKSKVDEQLALYIKSYQPDLIFITFAKYLDGESITIMREAAGNIKILALDVDPWPKLQKNRIETAKEVDILLATNDGQWLQEYRDAGIPLCRFIPNICDPDTDRRYEVGDKWKTDIIWTGTVSHKMCPGDSTRKNIVEKLAGKNNYKVYGCLGQPQVGGIEYLQAISGAKIGLHINAVNNIRLYHSDRIAHYLACGTMVIAKRIPDGDLLAKDKEHIRYFDEPEEFFELAEWYLKNENDRKQIADTGMKWAHEQFNCVKIAGYVLDIIKNGDYKAVWNRS